MKKPVRLILILSLALMLGACGAEAVKTGSEAKAQAQAEAECANIKSCFSLDPGNAYTALVRASNQASIYAVNEQRVDIGKRTFTPKGHAPVEVAEFDYDTLELPAGTWLFTLKAYKIEQAAGRIKHHDFSNAETLQVNIKGEREYMSYSVSSLGTDEKTGNWVPIIAEYKEGLGYRVVASTLHELIGMDLEGAERYYRELSAGRMTHGDLMRLRQELIKRD